MPRFSSLFILLTNTAVLVPAVTATVLPRKSSALLMLPSVRTIHLNCGTKNVYENPTCCCRTVILAVEPHSMSTVPLATSGMRVAEVTGLYLTFRSGMPNFAFTASFAQFDREADRLQLVVEIRQGQRALPITD